ncbi:MAG TPA: DNA gyrase C-terminal beta-propeller domain-containing protein, partial [Burkholderiaceae bacterium]
TGGFGLQAKASDMQTRQRGGKSFLAIEADDKLAGLSMSGRLLVFALDEVKVQSNGGRGLTLMDVDAKDPLVSVATFHEAIVVHGSTRAARPKQETLSGKTIAEYEGKRARKGKLAPGFKGGIRVVPA